ncbi:hypothetical protein L2K70_12770 [Nocardioides KLBMP 9356]|uniref:Uncharacterized protein n=1 Tax=Nocardioides potassii TaxID=2911371 RepID=A0ABS9HDV1_9ACTN|nr:hypothetical protein [Nocardioides potassii]MCF6378477.1 hypothetical protein [Nocardioides potassii]
MVAMVGANLEEVRALAAAFDRSAAQLNQTSAKVRNGIQISAWVGPFAVRFRHTWDSEHSVKLRQAANALTAQAKQLRAEADQQERASRAVTGATGVRTGGTTAPRTGTDTRSLLGTSPNPDGGDGDGVRIQKVRGADGVVRVIVHIRGTEFFGDAQGKHSVGENVLAAMGQDNATQTMIEEKLERAGVGRDDHVLFVGYSQGGLHAQNLARSGNYGDAVVITRGSPEVAGGMGPYDVLRFEVEGDIVVERLAAFDAANGLVRAVGGGGSGTDLVVRGGAGAEPRSWVDHVGFLGREASIHMGASVAFYQQLADDFDRSTSPEARLLQDRIKPFLDAQVLEDSDPE